MTDSTPHVRYVIVHRPGPAWVEGVDVREQPGIGVHVAHYRTLHAEGKLALGGPFLDNSGGMMVPIPDMTREEIEAFAAADPAIEQGLLRFEVKPWYVAMQLT